MNKSKIIILLVTILLIAILIGFFSIKLKSSNNNDDLTINTNSESEKTYDFFENTNIPTPRSVLGYEKPFMENDTLESDNYYYAAFLESGAKGFNSKVNGSKDYEKYKKLLLEAGYEYTSENKDGDITNYEFTNNEYKITIGITEDSFSITIEK